MKRSVFLVGSALFLALPGALLLPGCGGGGSGTLLGGNATPTPVPAVPFTASVDFGTGQSGTISLTRSGNNLSGTLNVVAANPGGPGQPRTAAKRVTHTGAFSFAITAGDYQISGTVTPPRQFHLTGHFLASNGTGTNVDTDFVIDGTLPTATEDGAYTLTANNETVSGIYPASPNAGGGTGGGGTGQSTADLTFSNPVSYNGSTAALSSGIGSFNKSTGTINTLEAVIGTQSDPARVVTISIASPTAIAQGNQFDIGGSGATAVIGSYSESNVTANPITTNFWGSGGDSGGTGRVTVQTLTANSVTLALHDVVFIHNGGGSTGQFTLNGTYTVPLETSAQRKK